MNKQKRIMAIHDISCVGRCSLTVALPILSVLGFDTAVLPTALLSTHTGGFERFTYHDLTAEMLPITNHWESLGLEFSALYSGFLGSLAQIDIVSTIFKRFRRDGTLVLVDPVMADNGVYYSGYNEAMAQGLRTLCSKADIITPNLTEAVFLLGETYKADGYDKSYIENLLYRLADLGAQQVVLTGISLSPGHIGTACYDAVSKNIYYSCSPQIEGIYPGTGDIFASTLLAALLKGRTLSTACQLAQSYTYRCIKLTKERELDPRYGVCFELALPDLLQAMQ
ncbi:MAG: pyridoxamine kinase [Clostridia bacterium]